MTEPEGGRAILFKVEEEVEGGTREEEDEDERGWRGGFLWKVERERGRSSKTYTTTERTVSPVYEREGNREKKGDERGEEVVSSSIFRSRLGFLGL